MTVDFKKHPAQKAGARVQGSLDPRFAAPFTAGLRFPVPEILECEAFFLEVIQEPLPLKPRILVKKSVFLAKRQKGITRTFLWTENAGRTRRRAF